MLDCHSKGPSSTSTARELLSTRRYLKIISDPVNMELNHKSRSLPSRPCTSLTISRVCPLLFDVRNSYMSPILPLFWDSGPVESPSPGPHSTNQHPNEVSICSNFSNVRRCVLESTWVPAAGSDQPKIAPVCTAIGEPAWRYRKEPVSEHQHCSGAALSMRVEISVDPIGSSFGRLHSTKK